MYKRDVAEIKDFVRFGGPDALVSVVLFVLLTIQAGLSTVKGQLKKVDEDGFRANCLWGKKADGYRYAKANKDFLYGKLYKIIQTHG